MINRVAGYKINMQKTVAFINTNSEVGEREIKKQLHLQLHLKYD